MSLGNVCQTSTPPGISPFSKQPTSLNSFSFPDVMTYHSKMLWRDSWISDFTTAILQEEYSSIQELPCLGVHQFKLITEEFFAHNAFPNNLGKTKVECLTLTSLKRSRETTNLVISITNGVREGELGMLTVFCHAHQAKIKACDALSTLDQCNLSELTMVVMSIYSNNPYIPRGTSHSLYLDMGSLSGGTFLWPISTR